MIRSLSILFLQGWLLALVAAAAPLERPVGHGLVYHRVHELPADLPAKKVGALVLDLRYVSANGNAADVTAVWLRAHASTRAPVFVLANSQTSRALLKMLASYERGRGVVVVGAAFSGFKPDIAVKTVADTERRAYEAIEKGMPLASLLADNPNKVRNDEANLSKDRLAEASAEAVTDAASGTTAAAPLIDVALQRAVHLHRTLVALKKI